MIDLMRAFEFNYMNNTYIILATTQSAAEEYFKVEHLDETEPDEEYTVKELIREELEEVIETEDGKGYSIQSFINMANDDMNFETYCLATDIGYL